MHVYIRVKQTEQPHALLPCLACFKGNMLKMLFVSDVYSEATCYVNYISRIRSSKEVIRTTCYTSARKEMVAHMRVCRKCTCHMISFNMP